MASRVSTKPRPSASGESPDKGYTPQVLDDCYKVIKKFFQSHPDRMDIRTLWSDSSGHWFRVNWWGVATKTKEEAKPLFGQKHNTSFSKTEIILDSEVVCVDQELVVHLKTVRKKDRGPGPIG